MITAVILIGGIALGFYMYEPPAKPVVRSVTKRTPVTKPKPNKQNDPLFDEAKKMLVNMGYTATEAKDLLQGVTGSTAQDYVNAAMQKVKI
jgi:Holliday junction resolvasome RuvABC DNA-binding subunit